MLLALVHVPRASSVAIYLGVWGMFLGGTIHLVDRHRPEGLRAREYLGVVLLASAVEEGVAYAVGGGLAGRATSLPQDWSIAVPVFLGMAGAALIGRAALGADPSRTMVAAAIVGGTFEMLGDLGHPLYVALLGGTAAWTYGGIIGLPLRTPERVDPRAPMVGGSFPSAVFEALLLTVGLVLGGLVGVTIGSHFG